MVANSSLLSTSRLPVRSRLATPCMTCTVRLRGRVTERVMTMLSPSASSTPPVSTRISRSWASDAVARASSPRALAAAVSWSTSLSSGSE